MTNDDAQDNEPNQVPIKPIEKLLNKHVDRSEFLAIAGAGVVGVLGLSPILKLFSKNHKVLVQSGKNREVGFGSGPYGV